MFSHNILLIHRTKQSDFCFFVLSEFPKPYLLFTSDHVWRWLTKAEGAAINFGSNLLFRQFKVPMWEGQRDSYKVGCLFPRQFLSTQVCTVLPVAQFVAGDSRGQTADCCAPDLQIDFQWLKDNLCWQIRLEIPSALSNLWRLQRDQHLLSIQVYVLCKESWRRSVFFPLYYNSISRVNWTTPKGLLKCKGFSYLFLEPETLAIAF